MTAFRLNVPIVSGVRTAVGRANKGTLINTRPDDLLATVMNEVVERTKGLEPKDVGDVVMGCAMPEGTQGMNIARIAVFRAGWPAEVTAEQEIQCRQEEVVVAGGVESMSQVPMGGHVVSLNPHLSDNHPEAYINMGATAERVADQFNVTREEQDQYATKAHQKAVDAIKAGRFKDQIVPVKARVFKDGKEEELVFDTDECPRADTSVEGLARLKPVFKMGGTVTAGNASPMNDGAAAVVLTSEEKLKKLGLKPLAYVRDYAVVGVPPEIMGIGPVPAIRKLLQQAGLKVEDIDLFEINEAFAAQAAYCQRELNIPDEKINVNGGAIALGHPLGGTGAKLTVQLIYEMKRRKVKYGIVSMCIGGGMGAAGLYENPEA